MTPKENSIMTGEQWHRTQRETRGSVQLTSSKQINKKRDEELLRFIRSTRLKTRKQQQQRKKKSSDKS
jgi:hypothetical protein